MARTQQGFLLESGIDARGTGRWHICGVDPIGSFEATDDRWHSRQTGLPPREGRGDAFAALHESKRAKLRVFLTSLTRAPRIVSP
jgi:hypothetical protein